MRIKMVLAVVLNLAGCLNIARAEPLPLRVSVNWSDSAEVQAANGQYEFPILDARCRSEAPEPRELCFARNALRAKAGFGRYITW